MINEYSGLIKQNNMMDAMERFHGAESGSNSKTSREVEAFCLWGTGIQIKEARRHNMRAMANVF